MVPALKHLVAVGNEARPIGGYYGSHCLPAMKIEGSGLRVSYAASFVGSAV